MAESEINAVRITAGTEVENGRHVVKIQRRLPNSVNYSTVDMLSSDEALQFAYRLMGAAIAVVEDDINEALRGDCSTCNNVRMIQDPDKDREWKIHCPDCPPREIPRVFDAKVPS